MTQGLCARRRGYAQQKRLRKGWADIVSALVKPLYRTWRIRQFQQLIRTGDPLVKQCPFVVNIVLNEFKLFIS